MDLSHLQQVLDAEKQALDAEKQALDAERQVIDAQKKLLEGSIRTLKLLKIRRNALVPISSLPTEILSAIFSLLRVSRASSRFTPGRGPDQRDRLAWLRVTHVCHRWREIVLDQPLFWNYVDFTAVSSAGAAEMLDRAKTVPLYLEARVPRGRWNDIRFVAFRKAVQENVENICHLDISVEPDELGLILRELVSPAPTLECLSLSSAWSSESFPGAESFVYDDIFDGLAPRLTCLELWRCSISWTAPLLRGLKHLKIRSALVRPNLSEWLDALDEMPRLETLVLHWASPIDVSVPFDVERTTTLPSLTYLDICADKSECSVALAHLVLPALTSLRLSTWSEIQTGDDVRELLPYFARHAHGPQDTRPLQSVLIRGERENADILAWPVPDIPLPLPPLTLAREPARVALLVTNERGFNPHPATTILDKAMAALPLDNLVTLTDKRRTRLDIQFWLRHAPRWPLLRRVRLAQRSAQGFVEMLLEDNHGGYGNPLLPSLTRLELVENALNARRTLRLCDALMRRVEQGLPLEVLDLSTCSMTSLAVRLLREIVVDVWGPAETLGSDDDVDDDDDDNDDEANYEDFSDTSEYLWSPIDE